MVFVTHTYSIDEESLFKGVLIRGVPLHILVGPVRGVLIRGFPLHI